MRRVTGIFWNREMWGNSAKVGEVREKAQSLGEWVSSWLTAHQLKIGYLVPL